MEPDLFREDVGKLQLAHARRVDDARPVLQGEEHRKVRRVVPAVVLLRQLAHPLIEPGRQPLRREDFPTPDCPTMTEVCPASIEARSARPSPVTAEQEWMAYPMRP